MDTDNSFWNICKPKLVPDIEDDELEVMIQQIKPIALVNEYRYREIITDNVNRREVAYTWSPRLGRPLRLYRGGLNETKIVTFHTWAYYGFFKPTLAEAYACIRQFVPDYSMVRYFYLDSEGMDRRNIIGDWHVCPCILFGDEQLNVIDQDWDNFVQECQLNDQAS